MCETLYKLKTLKQDATEMALHVLSYDLKRNDYRSGQLAATRWVTSSCAHLLIIFG